MIPCILMIATMWDGPPDFKCVTEETCHWLDVRTVLGRQTTVTRGDGDGRYTTSIKNVYCMSEHTGRIARNQR